ncbi:MAG: ABC transporter permease [Lachnospiraceae bacterium]|nr:ABC transporter permease [Lachnospiraceae bacterium]
MRENLVEALQEIWSHKMRSFLTMLGVIIGIASIIAIVSTIKGTNDQIMKDLVGKGNNNVSISLYQGDYEYYFEGDTVSEITQVTEEQQEEIRSIEHVEDATFYNSRTYVDNISAGSKVLSGGKIYGIDTHYLNTCGYVVYQGRAFVDIDYKKCNKVALLDSTAADILFPGENAVGQTLEISGEPFIIVGLYQQQTAFEPDIQNLSDYETYYTESYGTVLIPNVDWAICYKYDEPQNAFVRADDTENMSAIGKSAQKIMQECISSSGTDLTYTAEDLVEEAKQQQQLSNSTNNLLIWVASIALLVGGIGVMNIMLVSVTERTREIGLKRSLGARRRRILMQFLTESAVLTSLGGVLGVVIGIVMAVIISNISGTPVGISVPAIVVSVAFSMVIGILFGLLPSVKAANLNPIDALRRE